MFRKKNSFSLTLAVILISSATFSVSNGLTLVFSGRNLPSMDIFDGAPDAYINIYYAPNPTTQYTFFGDVINISNNRNPDWPEIFNINYNSSQQQRFKIDMYDADSPDADDYMGYIEVTLAEIYNSIDGVVTKNLVGGEPGGGQLVIRRTAF